MSRKTIVSQQKELQKSHMKIFGSKSSLSSGHMVVWSTAFLLIYVQQIFVEYLLLVGNGGFSSESSSFLEPLV